MPATPQPAPPPPPRVVYPAQHASRVVPLPPRVAMMSSPVLQPMLPNNVRQTSQPRAPVTMTIN